MARFVWSDAESAAGGPSNELRRPARSGTVVAESSPVSPDLRLTVDEQTELRRRTAGWTGAARTRARIVLAFARGIKPALVATAVGVSVQTARKWRRRFVEKRIAGLSDRKRMGTSRRIKPEAILRIEASLRDAALARGSLPSSRMLARSVGVSSSSVLRILKKLGANDK